MDTPVNIRVLLVDDHKLFLEGLHSLLERQPEMQVAGTANTAERALALTRKLVPDVIVMDITMRDINGIELTRRITGTFPSIKVLGLSIHNEKPLVQEMFRAGARGYLTKDCVSEDLVEAIQTVYAGRIYAPAAFGPDDVREYLYPSCKPAAKSYLSPTEHTILQALAEGKSIKQVARTMGRSPKTVETHRKHIMRKLGLASTAELTRYAIKEGLTPL